MPMTAHIKKDGAHTCSKISSQAIASLFEGVMARATAIAAVSDIGKRCCDGSKRMLLVPVLALALLNLTLCSRFRSPSWLCTCSSNERLWGKRTFHRAFS